MQKEIEIEESELIYLVMEEKKRWKNSTEFECEYYMREFKGEENLRKAIVELCDFTENDHLWYANIESLIQNIQDRDFQGVRWYNVYAVNDVTRRFVNKKHAKVVILGDYDY
jgi:hypothetical protein